MSKVARLATSWIPGIDIGPILEELRGRMSEELDYRLEASAHKAFAKGFEGDPNVAVPGVIDGTERVLVTEWMDGIPLSSIIADGTQEQRDLAGTHYIEFLLDAPGRCGLLHADPHPGKPGPSGQGGYQAVPDGLELRVPVRAYREDASLPSVVATSWR